MKSFPKFRRAIAGAMLVACLPGAAQAAAVVLWPVDPVIEADQNASALWIENKGSTPVTLQVRTLGWAQANGDENYAEQDEVVASPPIAAVPPGQRQLVRIIRRAKGTSDVEHSYRLLIDELPPVVDPTKPNAPGAQLSVQMRYSIPLFTYDTATSRSALNAHFEIEGGKRFLVIRNMGTKHARLVDLRLRAGGEPTTILSGLVGYVLPGSTMRWALPANAPLSGHILVNVNGGDVSLSPSV
jgi:fimbrial chaperone protein